MRKKQVFPLNLNKSFFFKIWIIILHLKKQKEIMKEISIKSKITLNNGVQMPMFGLGKLLENYFKFATIIIINNIFDKRYVSI